MREMTDPASTPARPAADVTRSDAQPRRDESAGRFAVRVVIAVAVAALALAAWVVRDVLFVLFGAVVIANGMSLAATALSIRIKLGHAASLSIVVFLVAAFLGSVLGLFGTLILGQLDELRQTLPAGVQWIRNEIEARPQVREWVSGLDTSDFTASTQWAAAAIAPTVATLLRMVAAIALTLVISVYLAAQPNRYRGGLLRVAPEAARARVSVLLEAASSALGRWLAGQLVVMVSVAILSGIGLWLLGVRTAFALGLVGGLLAFLPFFGPILTAGVATLIALAQGPSYAVAVAAMYAAIHVMEGNFLTPLIQSEATSLPPVVTVLSVIACATLFGPGEAFLAAPLALLVLTAIKVIWLTPRDPI